MVSVAVIFPTAIAVPGTGPYTVHDVAGGIGAPTDVCPTGVRVGVGWTVEWENFQSGMSDGWPRGKQVRDSTVIWRSEVAPVTTFPM